MVWIQIFWSMALATVTVALHGLYTVRIVNSLKKQAHQIDWTHIGKWRFSLLVEALILLLFLHCLEATVWAWFYTWKNALPDLETALYFSMTSYTTIGYGDIVLPSTMRLVGAIEGMVGTLMFGWSVALLIAIVQAIVLGKERTQQ